MKRQRLLTLLALSSLLGAPAAGRQTPTPARTPAPSDEVVRITSNLVQVDVTVTDKDGRPVTDLRPEDFEIVEDGRRQKITNFSFVTTGSAGAVAARPHAVATKTTPRAANNAPPAKRGTTAKTDDATAAAAASPDRARRTVALVVDDLGMSLESMSSVRAALRKFIEEQVRPGDLVSIIRTSGGTGQSERFTTDRSLLRAAVERVRWYPSGRVDDFAAAGTAKEGMNEPDMAEAMRKAEEFRRTAFTAGTLNSISSVLRAMRNLPGRKSLVLVGESFTFTTTDEGRSELITRGLRRLAEQANHASVVIYTLNSGGLQTLGWTAADQRPYVEPALTLKQQRSDPNNASGGDGSITGDGQVIRAGSVSTPGNNVAPASLAPGKQQPHGGLGNVQQLLEQSRARYFESADVLKYLADETGGLAVRNTNDLAGGIRRALEDQSSYYLIAYRPDEKNLDPQTGRPVLHKITVKVKRSGARVRTRSGFSAVAAGARASDARTASAISPPAPSLVSSSSLSSLSSLSSANDIGVRLTSLFGDEGAGSFLRSLLHIDAQRLTFREEPDGTRRATADIVATVLDAGGNVVDKIGGAQSIVVRHDAYERLLRAGMVGVLNVPIKRPGAYHLRVVVRDAGSGRAGTASQFVEVPDLSKNDLVLSGVALSGSGDTEAGVVGASEDAAAQSGPAVRRFKAGAVMRYGFVVYNAQAGAQTGRPSLRARLRLLKDGRPVFEGGERAPEAAAQTDARRVVVGGSFLIGRDLPPGEYVLQVVVTDTLAKGKQQTATQWTDFEIVQ